MTYVKTIKELQQKPGKELGLVKMSQTTKVRQQKKSRKGTQSPKMNKEYYNLGFWEEVDI